VKPGWRKATIGDVCEVVNGGTPKTGVATYWGGAHMWITPAEMGGRSDPYVGETERQLTDAGLAAANLLPPHSVILSSRAPIGHLVINTVPMATNQGCKGLIPKPSLDDKYLFYYLGSIVGLLNDLGTGATFKELSGGKLKEVPIPLPSLAEQQRIVAILDDAFARLATAIANAEKNLKNTRELFESYVDSVFQGEGELDTLSTLASEVTDGDHMPPPKAKDGVPFITISNINKGTHEIDFSDTFKVPESYYAGLKENKKPRSGDVLYTVTGSYGIPVLVETSEKFCFQRHVALIRPKEGVNCRWLYYALRSKLAFDQASSGATGTAQKTVSLKVLRNIRLPRMSSSLQTEITAKLVSLSGVTQRLTRIYRAKLDSAAKLKQSILEKAFSGELTPLPSLAIKEAAE
jgi:type I restriction enzyme S subunit